jgi:hypothetical protein
VSGIVVLGNGDVDLKEIAFDPQCDGVIPARVLVPQKDTLPDSKTLLSESDSDQRAI